MTALLKLTDITLKIDHASVLDNLDLSVDAGRIHALLGANGSGKSSLARMIMGCQGYTPASGKIHFDGHELSDWPMHRRARAGISMAWQEPTRFEGMTVRSYLSLDPSWHKPEPCLEAVGLAPEVYLERKMDKGLSGGERKRIEVAAMLAMRPRLAMLDEPTAGIDILSLEEVTDAIRTLQQGGSAVLLITHQESLVACADQASQLCTGRIVFSGSPDEVVRHYRERTCLRCDGSCPNHD